MRLRAVTLAAFVLTATPALADDEPRLTRVEPRPFYGATVTVEHGVRVYRSLPPHRDVVIAPQDGPPIDLHLWRGESGASSSAAPTATASASATSTGSGQFGSLASGVNAPRSQVERRNGPVRRHVSGDGRTVQHGIPVIPGRIR
jgi:hypothetical protein